uniref:Uncharacterized protein n=1 Tax=Capra hircus TaxID=9925 RepID=A0A8C2PIK9_CAPHI
FTAFSPLLGGAGHQQGGPQPGWVHPGTWMSFQGLPGGSGIWLEWGRCPEVSWRVPQPEGEAGARVETSFSVNECVLPLKKNLFIYLAVLGLSYGTWTFSRACGILVPGQGIESMSLVLGSRSLTTGSPGMSHPTTSLPEVRNLKDPEEEC